MSGKMRIIILVVIAIASFGAAYFAAPWLGDKKAPVMTAKQKGAADLDAAAKRVAIVAPSTEDASIMKEKELASLIIELRLKLDDFKTKENEFADSEKRIAIAGEGLVKQAQELEKLRLGLIPAIQRYQEIKATVEASLIQIVADEEKNIKLLAGRYDSMDAEGAARILVDLWTGKQQELAVKIFYYMQPRSAAKVLSAMSSSTDEGAAKIAPELSEKFRAVRKPSVKEG